MIDDLPYVHTAPLTDALDLTGVFANGLLGGTVARQHGLDLFGFVAVGLVSALGGGIIRDVLLQAGPPAALTDDLYIPVALASTLTAFLLNVGSQGRFESPGGRWSFTVVDAAALSTWALAGAQKTLATGLGWLPALLLGVVTAVGGGAIRDVLLRQVPAIFGGTGLYASVALRVAGLGVLANQLHVSAAGTVLGLAAGVTLKLVADRRGWYLPGGVDLRPGTGALNRRLRRGSASTDRGGAGWWRRRRG